MKTRAVKLLPVFLMLMLLLAVTPIHVFAQESRPAISVPEGEKPLVGSYPIRVYVYPGAYDVEDEARPFQCDSLQEIQLAIYDALRDLHHIAVRFVDEHPQYYQLVLIRFANASSPDEADITVMVVGSSGEAPKYAGYILYGATKPLRIGLLCHVNMTYYDYYKTFLHELLHALGLDHAKQQSTDDGGWELMYPAGVPGAMVYPSTLDLYALYLVHFGDAGGGLIELPEDISYVQVKPYQLELRELESLREESARLRDAVARLSRENNIMRGRLVKANSTIESLREELEAVRRIRDSYIRAYDSLQNKYEMLRANCSTLLIFCNRTIHECAHELDRAHERLANLTDKYNELVDLYGRIYRDYHDAVARLYYLFGLFCAALAVLGGGALWLSMRYDKLQAKYRELIESLEGGEGRHE